MALLIGYDMALKHDPYSGDPMSLSAEEVNKIAWLGRLAIDADKVDAYARDLSGILDFVAQMSAVDTSAVAPMAHPMDQAQRLRLDKVAEADQRELFQAHAPRVEAGLYLVPKVIE
jgi:aspartyl-tRNA(Asn)/glutamyl-tRNA(Gln) amidotransferase subunit C